MNTKIAAAFALIARTTDRRKLLDIASNADKQGVASVADGARAKFDELVAEDAGDPIAPAWDDMLAAGERALGHRHNFARRLIESRVTAGFTRRDAIVESLTKWALDPKPTAGFLAMLKADNLETSGEALVIKFAEAFPLTVVTAARRRLEDARRGAFDTLA